MTQTASPPRMRTPLAAWHAAHGGRMVDFAGWEMPVQYGSIIDEHAATRTGVGLFDVSHMGRLSAVGPDAARLLDRVLTRSPLALRPGRVRYSLVCNEQGGVLDDVLVARGSEDQHGVDFGLVVNASNRAKIWGWLERHAAGLDVALADATTRTAMIAVQGPGAVAMVAGLGDAPLASMAYYTALESVEVAGVRCSISRTGYTGEDGVELFVDAADAVPLWERLVAAGGRPCGLAARDTLRLEAGMPLYGHELDEQTTPIEAGLAFAVDFTGPGGAAREFFGREALAAHRDTGVARTRVGLGVDGKRPPREGYAVLAPGKAAPPIGAVTSGTLSPTLGRGVAMAYVSPAYAAAGTELAIDVRGALASARVEPLPFYRRERR